MHYTAKPVANLFEAFVVDGYHGVNNYPVFNISTNKQGDNKIEVALAGWTKEELKVEVDGNSLVVSGTRKQDEEKDTGWSFQVQKIAKRNFVRRFENIQSYDIDSISFESGLLTILLIRKKKELTIS